MSYSPPPLGAPIVLAAGYAPPSLAVPVILCPVVLVGGELLVDVPSPLPSAEFSGGGRAGYPAALGMSAGVPLLLASARMDQQPLREAPDLWAAGPAPNAHELTAAPSAAGVLGHPARLSVDQAAPQPAAAFSGRERAYLAAVEVAASPLVFDPAIAGSGATVLVSALASLSAPLVTAPEVSAGGALDIALPDAMGPRLVSRWQQARGCAAPLALAQRPMLAARRSARIAQGKSDPAAAGCAAAHAETLRSRRRSSARHAQGTPLARGARSASAETVRSRHSMALAEAKAAFCRAGSRAAHAENVRTRRRAGMPHIDAPAAWRRLLAGHNAAKPGATALSLRWQHAEKPAPGRWWPRYEAPPLFGFVLPCTGGYVARPLRCPVVLGIGYVVQPPCPVVPPPGTIVIPVREVYLVINTTSIVRASDGLPIETGNFSATLDVDSWCWSWSASLAAELRPLVASPVRGEHVELIATINGTALRLVVEKIGRDRRFAGATLKISGRGRAAWLSDPHSPVQSRYNAEARTAQQLLADALTINDAAIGWGIDWRITDWNVPAGAWSQSGTYIEAAQRIAEAGGGYVQAHNTDQTLIVLPRYPAAPWHWAGLTPDIVLPEDVCEVEGIEWQDKAPYNAVYVVGGEHGRADRVLRAGTAANVMAPTIVDPLATAPEMTRQRGLACIADTGRQAHITLRLPVLPETGIIQPGKLIDYSEGGITRRGLSRAVTVDHAFPSVWQSIRIETHELEPV